MRGRVLEYTTLDWIEENRDADSLRFNLPHSNQYNDIYFAQHGIEETKHVFLDGNNLTERFSKSSRFCIAETGFGTGLNILSAWKLWENTHRPDHATLHFLSFEKHPLHPDDLAKAHANWPELEPYAKKLRILWPAPITGFHLLPLSSHVTLSIYYGDIADGMRASSDHSPSIDAWFLDGFSPAKNPDMWSHDIFEGMSALSRANASFSTFTVAGDVRRGLAKAGFEISKKPGFGRKREMLTGKLGVTNQTITLPTDDKTTNIETAPWYNYSTIPHIKTGSQIAIIGGGIAGASLAHALTVNGFQPFIFERDKPAAGASGNMAGLIMPRLDRDTTPAADFSVHAWLYTLRMIQQLQDDNPGTSLFNPCGTARLANDREDKTQIQSLIEEDLLPKEWIKKHEAGILFPMGGVVSPPDFVRLLIAKTPIIKEKVTKVTQSGSALLVHTDRNNHQVDCVIFANGFGALSFLQARGLPLMASLGQLEIFPNAPKPEEAFSHGPYAAPLADREQPDGMVIGATYRPVDRYDAHHTPTKAATAENIRRLAQYRPDITSHLNHDQAIPRASVRCMTPDQLPVAGPLPDWGFYSGAYDGVRTGRLENYPNGHYQKNIFILSGLGSRGLVTAPLAAAMIASQLAGTPPPVTKQIYDALHPGRFFIRELKRTKPA